MITAGELREETRAIWERVFTPPRRLGIAAWADQDRYLSPEYNADAQRARGPVRWATDRVPYLRGIMDALDDPGIREVTVKKGAQVGGSECAQNWIGWTVAESPAPMLIVCQTEKQLRAFSVRRLDPMIRDTPTLRLRIPPARRRSPDNATASKTFPGGYVQLLTAKSTADLRSWSTGRLIAEEIDEWEGDIRNQGDPLELLRMRGSTFAELFKLLKISTPLLDGFSRITAEYDDSSQGLYHVPCPACNAYQPLRWRDAGDGRYRLVFERDAADAPILESVRYQCAACDALIDERHKIPMLGAGRWVHAVPDRIAQNCGFHIWRAYSPFGSWASIVAEFLKAKRDPTKLQTFVNLTLGEAFRHTGEQLEPHVLSLRAEPYPETAEGELLLPAGVGVLTAGVDVQGDRLEVLLLGWGAGEEAWVYAWLQLEGDPGQKEVWQALDQHILRTWPHAGGVQLSIAATAVDAGYQTEQAWSYCEARRGRGVFATVGREGRGPMLQAPPPQKFKHARAERRPMHVIRTDSAKDHLAGCLRTKEAGPGYIHFPDTLDAAYYDQLTAERLVTTYRRRMASRTWVLIPGRRNEALDLTILAMIALHKLGRRVIAQLGARAAHAAQGPPTGGTPPPARRGRVIRSPGLKF